MFLKEYLSINESLDYLEKKIKDNNDVQRSAKTILTNAIDLFGLRPSFKYKGYGTLYRATREKESRNSIEFKQVFRISGYFYDSSTFHPDDFETFSQFSNLDEPFFYASMAVVDKLVNHDYLTTHYLSNINDDDIHRSKVGKNSEIEEFNFHSHQYLRLTDDYPIFDDFIQTNTESVKIPRNNIFFKIDDLNYVIESFSDSKDTLNNSLISDLKDQILDFETELAQVKAKLKEQTDKLAHAAIDEGQGDTLLILGAVMQCIKSVAKNNYTQTSLINAIIKEYPNTKSISESTLSKKFSKAKTHLNQNVTP